MRVRPLRPTDRRARSERRPHVFGRPGEAAEEDPDTAEPAAAAQAQPQPQPVIREEHLAERRHRESVAPEDTAHYACSCGFQFQASVSTSVCCPHCGTGQAW
jgi:hypothetical protein